MEPRTVGFRLATCFHSVRQTLVFDVAGIDGALSESRDMLLSESLKQMIVMIMVVAILTGRIGCEGGDFAVDVDGAMAPSMRMMDRLPPSAKTLLSHHVKTHSVFESASGGHGLHPSPLTAGVRTVASVSSLYVTKT